MNFSVDKVRIILAGYEPGDRVVVFRDTGSFLQDLTRLLPRSGVIVEPIAGHENDHPGCHLVLVDRPPRNNGTVNGWWVLPQDLRLE